MQMCPECGKYYDESEDSRCPFCCASDDRPVLHIVFDREKGEALDLTDEEYEEFKKTHPEYR